MTKPTVERTPFEEARLYYDRWIANTFILDVPWTEAGQQEADRRWKAVEESIRADEATRWREAVQEAVVNATDSEHGDTWCKECLMDVDRPDPACNICRLRALLQEEDR